jgi:hypothetical protein
MSTLMVTCGALAREVIRLRDRHGWHAKVLAIPANLHNRPERIPAAVHQRVREAGPFERVVVVYGDCGTGGVLDETVAELGAVRVEGPHCYEQYAGDRFGELMDSEPGTFFLTDFLARAFRPLVMRGLALDRRPDLREDYFGAYRRVVYLQQESTPELVAAAHAAAADLQLPLEVIPTGLGALEERLLEIMAADLSVQNAPNSLTGE